MKPCLECGSPIVQSDSYCPSCGAPTRGTKPKGTEKRRCDVTGCEREADFHAGAYRCWPHYNADMDRAKMDWREKAIQAEAARLGLTPGRKGENLTQYMERHGIDKRALRIYERIPGSDDE